jgi:hypothetical protein
MARDESIQPASHPSTADFPVKGSLTTFDVSTSPTGSGLAFATHTLSPQDIIFCCVRACILHWVAFFFLKGMILVNRLGSSYTPSILQAFFVPTYMVPTEAFGMIGVLRVVEEKSSSEGGTRLKASRKRDNSNRLRADNEILNLSHITAFACFRAHPLSQHLTNSIWRF